MKILLVADIHSNWPALKAIHEDFDACLFLGDMVDYCADPVACIDWVRRHATHSVRGNHDHAVAQRIPAKVGNGYRRIAMATRPMHWTAIDPARMKFLARLPVHEYVTLDGATFCLVHATPRDPMDEYLLADRDAWKARLDGVDARFVCVGHTHVPFVLELDGQTVINPGSVGQPRDGDPRAAYAVIEDGKIELRRVEYDIDETLQQMRTWDLPPWAIEATEQILKTGGRLPQAEFERLLVDPPI
jgi:putative phosphoesterase